MSEILSSVWFIQGDSCIGIVLTRNSIGELKTYIGTGNGFDQLSDEKNIADYGASFPISAAKAFFPLIERELLEKTIGIEIEES